MCPVYDTKQPDAEAPVRLEFWGMRSNPSLPSLPATHCPEMVVPGRVLSIDQVELFDI